MKAKAKQKQIAQISINVLFCFLKYITGLLKRFNIDNIEFLYFIQHPVNYPPYVNNIILLLFLHLQDVLTSISERGPQYSQSEYQHLLQLYHRSFPGHSMSVQDQRNQRLQDIMDRDQEHLAWWYFSALTDMWYNVTWQYHCCCLIQG